MHSSSTFAPQMESAATAQTLAHIEALVERGLFAQAHSLAQSLGDYRQWRGPVAMALASRLVNQLGVPRLADVLAYLGYKRYPLAPESRLRYAYFLLARRGPYRAWQFMRQLAEWWPEHATHRAEWLAFQSRVYAQLRDFSRSAELHAQVQACAVDDPWLDVQRSYSLEREDRFHEALELCEAALLRHPDHHHALLQAADLQFQLNQDEQALARLRAAAARMESSAMCGQLAEQLLERQHLDEAWEWFDRSQQWALLADKNGGHWYAGRRCDIACLRGDYEAAAGYAEAAGGGFYQAIRERLAAPQGQRKVLPVTFIRQHHMTCAPATLTALSGYWGRAVSHLEVAEAICYDGTSHLAERTWAQNNQWLTVEFTVDWPTSVALIDRGVPFTLTVQYTGSGHLQAVVGYDEPRGSLLIRDPAQSQFAEYLAEPLFINQAVAGPRGMLMLPMDEAARIDGVHLPDRELWDIYYRFNAALQNHQRADAVACVDELLASAPDHRLTLQAQRALYGYDGREQQTLEAVEKLLERFPADSNLILSKTSSLTVLQPRDVQLAWLQSHCQERWSDPLITLRYADLLSADERMNVQVQLLAERALRQSPFEPHGWRILAGQRWSEGLREQACELYRIASCLNGTLEGFAGEYFRAMRCVGRVDEGLLFLRQRQARLGRLDAGPSLTLSEFLEELEMNREARAALEQAQQWRPQDADVLLSLASFCSRHGDHEQALAWLQQAEPYSRRSSWLRASVLCSQRSNGDFNQALAWCQEAAALEPLNMVSHRMLVRLLVLTEGDEAADAYVQGLIAEHPHHYGIAELHVQRAQRISLSHAEAALRRLLEHHPQDAWALRELAVVLTRQGRPDEALTLCELAKSFNSNTPALYQTLAYVLLQHGQREQARDALRTALRLSVDSDYAIGVLVDTGDSREEAQQDLAFIHSELARQITFGAGWMAYAEQAQGLIEPEQVLEQLSDALHHRSDLWQLWVVLARQHGRMGQPEKAGSVLQSAIERFPFLPRLSLEKADLQKQQGQLEDSLATLRESFRISPHWTATVSLYVDCLLELGGRLPEAETLLRDVLKREPDDSELRAYLAYVLGEQEIYVYAADEAERVLRDEPGNGWAWNQLRRYCEALKEPRRPLQLAQELVQRRSADVDAWLALAILEADAEAKERALREALRYSPRHRQGNERLLNLLLQAKRYDELHALLAAPVWGGSVPVELAVFGPRALYEAEQVETAIAGMQQLVELHPAYRDGWEELAKWYDAQERYADYLTAAQQLVHIEPKSAVSYGYLGHALLVSGRDEEALPMFEKAFAQDPEYAFAGFREVDLKLKLRSPAEALETVQRLLQSCPSPEAWTLGLKVARAANDLPLKERALLALATEGEAQNAWKQAMSDYPWKDKVLARQLEVGVEQGTLHEAAFDTWFRAQERKWGLEPLVKAFKKALRNDPNHAAKTAMLTLLADRQNCNRQLSLALDAARPAIATDGALWGTLTYALMRHGRYETMFAWLSDWQRDDVPVWGIDNVATALRIRGRHKSAHAVSLRSHEREPDGVDAMVWLAFDAAVAADHDALAHWLQSIGDATLRPYFSAVWHLLKGYARAVEGDDSQLAVWYFQAGKALAKRERHPPFKHLLRVLSKRLANGAMTPSWRRPARYLQLRF